MIRTCAETQERLSAFLDDELTVQEHLDVRQHLADCSVCQNELAAYEEMGGWLRETGQGRSVEMAGLADAVVSRVSAEGREAWFARLSRAFDDMHLVWAGLSATGAVIVCAGLAAALVLLAPREERADSLRGIVSALSLSGSDLEPMLLRPGLEVPRVSPEAITPVMLASTLPGPWSASDSDVAVAAVVTRDGRVSGARIVDGEAYAGFTESLEESARFQPASRRGVPVAVSLVWVMSHTTVRPMAPADLVKPQSALRSPSDVSS
jgi:anti-sigma factor RsiW